MANRCVLITGAARRVGAAIARELSEQGYFVWLHYNRSETEAISLCRELIENGGRAKTIHADLADCSQIVSMFDAVVDCPPDTLIVNHSLFLEKDLLSTTPDEWDEVLRINLKAAWYASRCFAEKFPQTARQILFVGDANTARGYRNHAVYGLSKASLVYLMRQLAEVMAPMICVNMISPAFLVKGENESREIWEGRRRSSLIFQEDPVKDFLNGILFLLSEKQQGITGQNMEIDGGMGIWKRNI